MKERFRMRMRCEGCVSACYGLGSGGQEPGRRGSSNASSHAALSCSHLRDWVPQMLAFRASCCRAAPGAHAPQAPRHSNRCGTSR